MKSVKISRSQIELLKEVILNFLKTPREAKAEKDLRIVLNKLENCLIEIERGELK